MRLTVLLPIFALLIAGCARDVETQVTRFHGGQMPPGDTFEVVPAEGKASGPEFQSYAQLVNQNMADYGYKPAQQDPDLRVVIDWGVSEGRTKVDTYYSYPAYSFHVGRFHHPFHHGFIHPHHFGGFYGPRVETETIYTRWLRTQIVDTDTGEVVFEGRSVSEGPTQEISQIMPYLTAAMFRNFPGESGTTKVVEIETQRGARY